MKNTQAILFLTIVLFSCSSKEPAITDLKKEHSVEVNFETKHLGDTAVLLLTTQRVYLKGKMVKSIVRSDTLPAPGDTIQTIEDNDENEKNIKTPKEYEFFVTIK